MIQDSFGDFAGATEYVLNKDKAIDTFIRYMLARTQSMFAYEGLPETIPALNLEYLLQVKGSCFVTEVDGELYALSGNAGGEPDPYGEPTKYTVSNVALKLSKTYDIQNDGILFRNDSFEMGLLPIFKRYGSLLAENMITMRTVDIMLRMVCLISAPDDNTSASAEKFIRDIEAGKISAVGENQFFEGVRVHNVSNTQNYLQQFVDFEQYLKASCFNEIGLDSNYNMKRANLTEKEVSMNDDFLLPLVDNMIKQRQDAIDRINKKYGQHITIDYASAWKVTHMENEKEIAIAEDSINGEPLQSDTGGNQQTGNGSNPEVESVPDGTEGLPVVSGKSDRKTSTGYETSGFADTETEGVEHGTDGEGADTETVLEADSAKPDETGREGREEADEREEVTDNDEHESKKRVSD